MSDNIKVLVVDDSALMRNLLAELLNSDRRITVVGAAKDAYDARDKIKELNPDVLTLDVEMPKMDGLSFLGNLMRLRPMPVVMISTLTEKGAAVTMRALELGAVDFVAKPKIDVAHTLEEYAEDITSKVKAASTARVGRTAPNPGVSRSAATSNAPVGELNYSTTDKVIAIGASTGGTEAIKEVLLGLRPDLPGIVIAQHIPPVFSRSFADRMNDVTQLSVCEARDGQQIRPGHAYVAPGDQHLTVRRDGAKYVCRLTDGEPVNRHKPSVDVLFDSVAKAASDNALGVILTGMGKDGAQGLKRMQEAGAVTIAQDEQTSVVWGMPGSAVAAGGVDNVLPLESIAGKVTNLILSQELSSRVKTGAKA